METYNLCFMCTFDVNEAVEESDGFDREKVGQVLHADFEGIPVVELQVGVDGETQVLLNLLTQLVQEVLWERNTKKQVSKRGEILPVSYIWIISTLYPLLMRKSHLYLAL